jgi:DNA polymerase I-like protein with 3'-5' exonuclease and polymerase domains
VLLSPNKAYVFNIYPRNRVVALARPKPTIVHTQHDEIIIEARDGIEDQVQVIVKESMEEAFQGIIPEVPFVADIRVAEAWR